MSATLLPFDVGGSVYVGGDFLSNITLGEPKLAILIGITLVLFTGVLGCHASFANRSESLGLRCT